jgi:hypothetical protein
MRKGYMMLLVIVLVMSAMMTAGASSPAKNFTAHLSGGQEVPMNDSKAAGQAVFHLSEDGQSLTFKVDVANIDSVKAAHLHNAAAGTNGKVVVTLFGSPGVTVNGELASGTITAADVIGLDWEGFLTELRSGNIYVNVHTANFPGGEIRGQVQ